MSLEPLHGILGIKNAFSEPNEDFQYHMDDKRVMLEFAQPKDLFRRHKTKTTEGTKPKDWILDEP